MIEVDRQTRAGARMTEGRVHAAPPPSSLATVSIDFSGGSGTIEILIAYDLKAVECPPRNGRGGHSH
jgi:hypothetical protein